MDDIETFSHHSIINLSQKNSELKLRKCWDYLLAFKFSNIITFLNITLSLCTVAIYIYTTYEPNTVLIYSKYFL